MEEGYTIAEEALASISHQGMIRNPIFVIPAHCMRRSTFLYAADLEQQSCTALCKSSKEERRNHPSWGHSNCSFIHEAMEEEMMNGRHLGMRNLFSFLDASFSMSTPQRKEKLLSTGDPEPQWFWKDICERSFLEDLKGSAFQKPLKCIRCETMRTQREDREEGQLHSYPLQKVETPRKVIGLRSRSMEGILHSCIQSPLIGEISLYEDNGTIHGQHVSLLSKDETLEIAEGKIEGKLHMVRNICPSLFQHDDAKRRQNDLCKQSKDISVHTSFHDLCLDVSLLEGIPPRSSHNEQKNKVFPQPCASMSSLLREKLSQRWRLWVRSMLT